MRCLRFPERLIAQLLLEVAIGWQNDTGGGHQTVLEDPLGNLVSTSFRRISDSNTNDVWEVPGPMEGTYQLQVLTLPQPFFVTASLLSHYELYHLIGAPDVSSGNQGTEVPIVAMFVGPGGAITGATVDAVVTDPNGGQQAMTLFDDGSHGARCWP